MKICKSCNLEKNTTDYWKASKNKDGLQTNCKDCDKAANRKSSGRRRWIYKRRVDMIEYLRDLKSNTPCAECGEYYAGHIMQFDHVRGEKKYELSKAGTNFSSWETLQVEVDKCDIVCANCHADRTFKRREIVDEASDEK